VPPRSFIAFSAALLMLSPIPIAVSFVDTVRPACRPAPLA
jgi:hypothetical protein